MRISPAAGGECLAITHVPFEGPGLIAAILRERGGEVRTLQAGIDDLAAADPLALGLLVVLGGPIGANDEADYPFLADEPRLLERRLAADRPTLGICLGAQLTARALGARVYPAPRKEIGWASVALVDAVELRDDLDPDDAAYLIIGLVQGLAVRWSISGRNFDLTEEGSRLLELQLSGLAYGGVGTDGERGTS